MRWRVQVADFDPEGFDSEGFATGGSSSPDSAGVRAILFNYQPPGIKRVTYLAIDVDHEMGVEVAVVTTSDCLGLVRIRELSTDTWYDITDSVATTWRRAGIQSTLNVEVELTVPTGAPREILLRQLFQIP